MGSRCPTLRKSPSTLPHRRAFWGFRGEWGAVPPRIVGVERAAFALLFCARASFCTVGGEYTTRGRGEATAHRKRPETDNEWRETWREGACFDASACVGLRMPLLNLRAGHKNTAAFSQIMGDFAEKQRCFGVRCGARSKTGAGRRNKWERRARIWVSAATTCSLANR